MFVINKKPIVSIILPTYNRAHIIEKSIRSVLQQTFTNFELIIVDDGSTDNTEEVVKSIDDDRIKYIKYPENKGANVARNLGISLAQGVYIGFQDSDDEWYIDKLEKQVRLMKSSLPIIGVVYSAYMRDEKNEKIYIPTDDIIKLDGNILEELLTHNFVDTPTMLIRKECFDKIGDFDESLPRFQDWEMAIRLAEHYHFKYMNEATLDAYIQSDSISNNKESGKKALSIILKKHIQKYTQNNELTTRQYNLIGMNLFLYGNTKDGQSYLWKAYKKNLFNIKILLKIPLLLLGTTMYKKVIWMYWSIETKLRNFLEKLSQ